MGRKTKIDWCDSTWNPVSGCLHGCKYCYARRIAERFGVVCQEWNTEAGHEWDVYEGTKENHVLDEPMIREWKNGKVTKAPFPFCFDPTFHRYRLNDPQKWKNPKTIFVCSMADLFGEWVPDEWIRQVFDACDAAPQHRYIFLTKNPKRLHKMASSSIMRLPERENWWFGSSLDNKYACKFDCGYRWNSFASIEPLTEYMDVDHDSFDGIQWIIVGAETGNRKNKIIPEKLWVDNIVGAARITGAAVFMKESLRGLMGDQFVQELPWR